MAKTVKPRSQSELRRQPLEDRTRLAITMEARMVEALRVLALEQHTSVAELVRVAILRTYGGKPMFRIEVTKSIGGDGVSVPTLTCESEKQARAKLDEIVEALKAELDAPMMRYVGGRAEVFLTRVAHMFDAGDVLEHIIIKRPLNSPGVMLNGATKTGTEKT